MKVLIIQLRQLGDVLLSTPLARALKEKGVKVHFLTSEAGRDIVEGNPFIDGIETLKEGSRELLKTALALRKEGFDAVIDAQRTGRSRLITLLSGAPLRVAFRKERGNLFYNRLVEWENRGYTAWERLKLLEGLGLKLESYRNYLPEIYKIPENPFKGREYAVIVPTARKSHKMWPAEKFAELAAELRKEMEVIVLFGPGEREAALKVNELAGGGLTVPESPFPIKAAAAVMKGAGVVIGNNSFAPHLAVAVGSKVVVIDKKRSGWFPPIERVREVYGNNSFPEVEQVKEAVAQLLNG
ncbi:glycosyltransferase family 9 protein [Thermovibrio ammonificans]